MTRPEREGGGGGLSLTGPLGKEPALSMARTTHWGAWKARNAESIGSFWGRGLPWLLHRSCPSRSPPRAQPLQGGYFTVRRSLGLPVCHSNTNKRVRKPDWIGKVVQPNPATACIHIPRGPSCLQPGEGRTLGSAPLLHALDLTPRSSCLLPSSPPSPRPALPTKCPGEADQARSPQPILLTTDSPVAACLPSVNRQRLHEDAVDTCANFWPGTLAQAARGHVWQKASQINAAAKLLAGAVFLGSSALFLKLLL